MMTNTRHKVGSMRDRLYSALMMLLLLTGIAQAQETTLELDGTQLAWSQLDVDDNVQGSIVLAEEEV